MSPPVFPEGVSVAVELVTPEIAAKWLSFNPFNRSKRPSLVRVYAGDMLAGRWLFNGESICLAKDGSLLNGQHRLSSVVMSGVSLYMLVVRGLDPAVRSTFDGGAKRTAGDVLKMSGAVNAHSLASAARFAMYVDSLVREESFSNTDVGRFVSENLSLVDVFSSPLPVLQRGLLSYGLLGYLVWRLQALNAEASEVFWRSLRTLADLPDGSPVLALHRRLVGYVKEGSGWQVREERTALVFMAWNAWRKGETRAIIKLARSRDGRLMIPDPVS